MDLIRHLHADRQSACVATIGNFDGMHIGHQALIERLINKAESLGLPSCLILFEPQPLEYFTPHSAPARLCRLREKLHFLKNTRIDRVVILPFNVQLATMSAADFISELLLQQLQVRHLIVGEDFRFGKDRSGDVPLLQQYLSVEIASTIDYQDERVSSTRVRAVLAKGELAMAQHLLGRPYSMMGRVVHGAKRGRTIGFPTANLYLHRQMIPLHGVFAVKMCGLSTGIYTGVANLGTRPTVDGQRTLLEVHLFEFNADIYDQYVEVEFWKKLRDEQRYDSLALLKQQIALDVQQAKAYFSGSNEP